MPAAGALKLRPDLQQAELAEGAPTTNPSRDCGRAPLLRRVLSLAYESLLLAAVLMTGALPFLLLTQEADRIVARASFQLYLLALAGFYFSWQWLHGGQTLPMKTWRLKLITRDGEPLTAARALRRVVFAIAGTLGLGAGFLWALVDPDGQFLHDRLAGTKIVKEEDDRRKEKGNP
jgi:uncharacterized RDD family membrane protein YckC